MEAATLGFPEMLKDVPLDVIVPFRRRMVFMAYLSDLVKSVVSGRLVIGLLLKKLRWDL